MNTDPRNENDDSIPFDDLDFYTYERDIRKAFADMGVTIPPVETETKPDFTKMSSNQIQAKRLKLFIKGSKFAPVHKDDIVGIDSVLTQVEEVTHWLTNYKEYAKHKARPEPGVLFEGQPGTGKTYTSRYMATISGAKFIDVRDFPYVGRMISAQDIKDLFRMARETHEATGQPIILFWDEFESAARERSRPGVTGDQVSIVSQLTAELDGIGGKPAGILLIGCTNYADIIDMALKRPGRMGLHVEFNAPDRNGKKVLLEHYINKIRTKGIVDFDTASYFFNDWDTAATIEEAVQQAWRFAVKRSLMNGHSRPALSEPDLLEVFLKRLVGPPPAFADITQETLFGVSVHEVGHALASILFGVPLRLVTVRPGKEHLGKTMTYQADARSSTISEMLAQLHVGVGGIVAERVAGVPRRAGAGSDTKAITEIAVDLIDEEGWGSRTGLFNPIGVKRRHYSSSPSISASFIALADLDVKALIDNAERAVEVRFQQFGSENIAKLARKLIEVQTMTGKTFEEEVKKIGL